MAAIGVLITWVVLGFLISQVKNSRRRALLIGFGLALLLAPTNYGDGLNFASADLLMGVFVGEPQFALIAIVSIVVTTAVLSLIVLGVGTLLRKPQ